MIKQDELKQLMAYNADTGTFTWNERPSSMFKTQGLCDLWNRRFAGNEVSTRSGNGSDYVFIRMLVDGRQKKFRAHRLAYLWMTGEMPEFIDHIDQDKTNNSWSNLRSATRSQNGINRKPQSHNTSGVSGVSFNARAKKWISTIKQDGESTHLGTFESFEDAKSARIAAEVKRYGEFAYGT